NPGGFWHLTAKMDRVAAGENRRIEVGHSDAIGFEFQQRRLQAGVVFLVSEEGEVDVLAKLRCAVKYAGLAAHKQGLNLILPEGGKDLSDRGRDQGCLPWLGS